MALSLKLSLEKSARILLRQKDNLCSFLTIMKVDTNQHFSRKLSEKRSYESATFEEAMILTGYGKYNLTLLLVCGLVTVSFGLQFGLTSYILPSAQCDLQLSSSEMGLLNAGFLIGSATGAVPAGAIADSKGRRKVLIWTLLIDGCATILSSFSQNFIVLFIFRIINGLALGGPSTIIMSFLGEFHAQRCKSKVLCFAGFFWSIARILLPALAWIIIPLKFNIVVQGFSFNSWRLFIAVIGVPSIIGALLISKYPETPKFLLSQGKDDEALKIVQQIFASNTKQEASSYPVKTLISGYEMTKHEVNSLFATLKKMWEQICCVLSPPLRKYTILNATILFTNMAGNFGMGMWLPEFFNRLEVYYKLNPNTSITVCELSELRQTENKIVLGQSEDAYDLATLLNETVVQLSSNEPIEICESSVDAQVFINTITIGVTCMVANLASGYLANRWDSRIMPIVSSVIPGVCACAIYFLNTSMQNLIASCIFTAFLSLANIVLYNVVIEQFPTQFSAVASAVCSVAARLGAIISNILFGLLLDVNCGIPIFLVGGMVIFGGLLGFLLPTKPIVVPNKVKQTALSISNVIP